MKTKLFITLIVLLISGAGAYQLYNLYWKPDNFSRQIYLIPKDAMFIVETESPVSNWKKFSDSAPWQYLQQQEKMKEIGDMAQALDSLLQQNEALMNLLGKRNLMISAHTTRRGDYDFLFVIDMQKASKVETLREQLENLFASLDFKVTVRPFENYKIMELFNPADRSMLYISFIDNHLVGSYTGQLVEKSIQEKNNPFIGRDFYFQEIEQKMSGSGLLNIYINYKYFNNYLTSLMGVSDPDIKDICESMEYTGLQMKVSDAQLSLKGYTNLKDSTDSYMAALLQSGSNKITAQRILSNRTAFLVGMGFDDANLFMDNLENVLKNDANTYKTFKKNWDRIESYLGIDIRKNFLSWMEGEVVFAQNTPGSLGRQNEFVVAIKMKNKSNAITNLNFIEERIRKKLPIKFSTIDYEGYSIHYLEMTGFFRLLFGKLFNRLEKPYYTVVDDYVVFSNSTATLLSMVEDHRLGQTMDQDREFTGFMDEFNGKSSVFVYANTHKSFPLWKNFVAASTWSSLQTNRNFILCFPQVGFQLTADKTVFDTRLIAAFQAPEAEEEYTDTDIEVEDEIGNDNSSEDESLSDLQLFYVEKMSGNVYTEFYDDGSVKSNTEMKNGLRNGKYREFYPNGKLKSYGKFKNNKKHKTWYYYNEDESLLKKEKWKEGTLK